MQVCSMAEEQTCTACIGWLLQYAQALAEQPSYHAMKPKAGSAGDTPPSIERTPEDYRRQRGRQHQNEEHAFVETLPGTRTDSRVLTGLSINCQRSFAIKDNLDLFHEPSSSTLIESSAHIIAVAISEAASGETELYNPFNHAALIQHCMQDTTCLTGQTGRMTREPMSQRPMLWTMSRHRASPGFPTILQTPTLRTTFPTLRLRWISVTSTYQVSDPEVSAFMWYPCCRARKAAGWKYLPINR